MQFTASVRSPGSLSCPGRDVSPPSSPHLSPTLGTTEKEPRPQLLKTRNCQKEVEEEPTRQLLAPSLSGCGSAQVLSLG